VSIGANTVSTDAVFTTAIR